MAVTVADLHVHEWTKTSQRTSNKGRLWRCDCGEEAWSQRPQGPMYQGPFGWTERELEAMYWLVEGLNTRESAVAMGLAGGHTSVYLKNARRKARVKNTQELVKLYRLVYPDVE